MNSIKSPSNFTTDPGILVLTVLFLLIMFIIITKIIKKYKSTYTVFEKNNSVDISKIKAFHDNVTNYLQDVKNTISYIKNERDTIAFNEFIEIQDKYRDIAIKTLKYEYLPVSTTVNLELIQKQMTINFHNIKYTNLEEYLEIKNKIIGDLKEDEKAIISHVAFSEYDRSLVDFFNDYNAFMLYCKKNSKNAVIEKLKNLTPVSSFELGSFDESFSHIVNKRLEQDTTLYLMYNLTKDIFKKENANLLLKIKISKTLHHKLEDQEEKIKSLENKIESLKSLLVELEDELYILSNTTEKTGKYSILTSSLAKFNH